MMTHAELLALVQTATLVDMGGKWHENECSRLRLCFKRADGSLVDVNIEADYNTGDLEIHQSPRAHLDYAARYGPEDADKRPPLSSVRITSVWGDK